MRSLEAIAARTGGPGGCVTSADGWPSVVEGRDRHRGSTGIGRAVAGRVVAEGGAVVIAGRRAEPGERAAAELRAGGGSIINNASVGGVRGIAGLAPYAAAKHGVVGLSPAKILGTMTACPAKNDAMSAATARTK